jgi:hypothetical protein
MTRHLFTDAHADLLYIYTGWTVSKANDFMHLAEGQGDVVHPNTRASLRWARMIDKDDNLIDRGNRTYWFLRDLHERDWDSRSGPALPVHALEQLDPVKASRLEYSRNQTPRLLTMQVRILVAAARYPGCANYWLRNTYSGQAVDQLVEHGWIITRPGEYPFVGCSPAQKAVTYLKYAHQMQYQTGDLK